MKIARARTTELNGTPLLSFRTTVPSEWQLLAKRAMDLAIALPLIAFLSPLILVIAALIRITSPGPVFFLQERVGLNKRRFRHLQVQDDVANRPEGPCPGRYLRGDLRSGVEEPENDLRDARREGGSRKFSLDELPQLFNVVRGHMSLVGPRPTLPAEVEQYQTWFRRRFSMRPGMTCLWQVSGRREVLLDEWMQMDLEYLDHWSL